MSDRYTRPPHIDYLIQRYRKKETSADINHIRREKRYDLLRFYNMGINMRGNISSNPEVPTAKTIPPTLSSTEIQLESSQYSQGYRSSYMGESNNSSLASSTAKKDCMQLWPEFAPFYDNLFLKQPCQFISLFIKFLNTRMQDRQKEAIFHTFSEESREIMMKYVETEAPFEVFAQSLNLFKTHFYSFEDDGFRGRMEDILMKMCFEITELTQPHEIPWRYIQSCYNILGDLLIRKIYYFKRNPTLLTDIEFQKCQHLFEMQILSQQLKIHSHDHALQIQSFICLMKLCEETKRIEQLTEKNENWEIMELYFWYGLNILVDADEMDSLDYKTFEILIKLGIYFGDEYDNKYKWVSLEALSNTLMNNWILNTQELEDHRRKMESLIIWKMVTEVYVSDEVSRAKKEKTLPYLNILGILPTDPEKAEEIQLLYLSILGCIAKKNPKLCFTLLDIKYLSNRCNQRAKSYYWRSVRNYSYSY